MRVLIMAAYAAVVAAGIAYVVQSAFASLANVFPG